MEGQEVRFIVIYATHDYGIGTRGDCFAKDINEAIEKLIDPNTGGVPDHTDNVAERMLSDKKITKGEFDLYWNFLYGGEVKPGTEDAFAKVKKEAIRRTRIRFGIDKSDELDTYNQWAIIEVGDDIKTYDS